MVKVNPTALTGQYSAQQFNDEKETKFENMFNFS